MPLYELKCISCKTINECLLGLSEMPEVDAKREVDLKSIGIKCKKCKKTKFEKLISAHGKTASNWSSWQNPPTK